MIKNMLQERVNQNFGATSILFNWVDCDSADELVEHFDVEEVPALVTVMPHKQDHETKLGLTPE